MRWGLVKVILGGAGWTFFVGWQGWVEVYSGWLRVSGSVFCMSEHFLRVSEGGWCWWRYILDAWGLVDLFYG